MTDIAVLDDTMACTPLIDLGFSSDDSGLEKHDSEDGTLMGKDLESSQGNVYTDRTDPGPNVSKPGSMKATPDPTAMVHPQKLGSGILNS